MRAPPSTLGGVNAVRWLPFGALILVVTGCGFPLFLGLSPLEARGTTTYQAATVLGSGTLHQLRPVHAHNGRYAVNQVRHVFADVGLTCKRSPIYAGLVILGCGFPATTFRLSADISNPHYKGAILYGLHRIPGTLYTTRRNVTLAYRPAVKPFAQIVLSLLR